MSQACHMKLEGGVKVVKVNIMEVPLSNVTSLSYAVEVKVMVVKVDIREVLFSYVTGIAYAIKRNYYFLSLNALPGQ